MNTKICSKCGIEKSIESFNKHQDHTDGLRSECKDCTNKSKKQWRQKNKEQIREKEKKWENRWSQQPKGKFNKYKKNAKKRGIEWNLDFDQFTIYWQKNCYYCGSPIKTIGLDRMNNNKGYEQGNVISCCAQCNYAKRNLSSREFIELCNKIANRFSK